MDAVDQVLAQRAHRQSGPAPWASLGGATLLHAALLGIALLLPRLAKPPEPLQFVPVTVMPLQSLGVERPLARPAPPTPQPESPPTPAARPAPEPPAAKPSPPPKARPEEREPPVDERPALPSPAAAKKPERPEKPGKKPAEAHPPPLPAAPSQGRAGPGGVAAVGKGDELGRRGSAAGSPLGTSGLGSQIAGVEDPDFAYGYYLDRLLQLIDANWTRPPMASGVRAILHFRIRKDGGVDDIRVEESSGYNSFDLAALRAVQNASPFPALPASYRHDSLGVSLIVR